MEHDDLYLLEAYFPRTCFASAEHPHMPRPQIAIYEPDIEKAGSYLISDPMKLEPEFADLLGTIEQHLDLLAVAPSIPRGAYKLWVCNQVFEHLENPYKGAANIFELLQPGGVLVASSPFHAPNHGAPYDYWRYAPRGKVEMLRSVGFEVLVVCLFDTKVGVVAGTSVGVDGWYFSDHDMLEGFTCYQGDWVDAAGSEWTFNIHVVARKPLKNTNEEVEVG
ncbi:hypothetical protein TeGR_g6347 [Tetraparma gracilis]|uniref:Methyltransferase type 11 domain-containing protein n=1 Tax=Tetraparma gracilis TaxID=2962635 RepID=A0ABQ6MY14_9STRA|nr:hypothetical protein TeGR_g6347 [Tetraparma gracilis]